MTQWLGQCVFLENKYHFPKALKGEKREPVLRFTTCYSYFLNKPKKVIRYRFLLREIQEVATNYLLNKKEWAARCCAAFSPDGPQCSSDPFSVLFCSFFFFCPRRLHLLSFLTGWIVVCQWEAQQKSRVGGERGKGISSPRPPGPTLVLEAADYLQYYSSRGRTPPPCHLPLSCRNITSNLCPFCPKSENGFLELLASGHLISPCSSPCCPHLCHHTISKLSSLEPSKWISFFAS